MLPELDFRGKTVLVTAGGAGIGGACCEVFAELGADLVAVDVDTSALDTLKSTVSDDAGSCRAYTTDVTDERSVRDLRSDVETQLGRLDALINIVGTNNHNRIADLGLAEWEQVVQCNLTSVFLMVREFIPLLQDSEGAIVNMASTYGLIGNASMPAYCATKAGVVNLTRQIAVDYSPVNVRVNSVCPGPVMTPRRARYFEEGKGNREKSESKTLLGRMADPREIALVTAFLASRAASYVTGTSVLVDGGALAHAGVVA